MRARSRNLVVTLVVALMLTAFNVAPEFLLSGAEDRAPSTTAVATATSDSALSQLGDDIDEILNDPRLDGAQSGVVVRDASTGEHLYSRNGDGRLLPASNAKLLTSAAALDVLGPRYRFKTSVLAGGSRHGPVLRGNLYLKGTGDPTMLAADYDRLAAQVAATGLRYVRGKLVADDTWFDDVRLGREWAWSDEPYYYAAQVSALTVAPDTDFDAGTVIVTTAPGARPGAPARVELTPDTDYVEVVNKAITGESGAARTISVEREHGANTIVVSGTIPSGHDGLRRWASVWEPTGYAAAVFRKALRDHGVTVLGPTTRSATPSAAREIARRLSMPVSELLIPFMKLSNNGHAEVLVKAMGRARRDEGSWDAGLRVLTDAMAGLGLEPATFRMADGSGVSRWDLIPPEQLSILLLNAQEQDWFPVWYESLPVAGDPDRFEGGTLRSRMRGTAAEGNVHAKTGTLTGATALSGYLTSADGRRLIFSIMLNNYLSSSPKDLEDQIAITLAEYDGDVSPAEAERGREGRLEPRAGDTASASPLGAARRAGGPSGLDRSSIECSWAKAC